MHRFVLCINVLDRLVIVMWRILRFSCNAIGLRHDDGRPTEAHRIASASVTIPIGQRVYASIHVLFVQRVEDATVQTVAGRELVAKLTCIVCQRECLGIAIGV